MLTVSYSVTALHQPINQHHKNVKIPCDCTTFGHFSRKYIRTYIYMYGLADRETHTVSIHTVT